MFRMSGEQVRFQVPPKLPGVDRITEMSTPIGHDLFSVLDHYVHTSCNYLSTESICNGFPVQYHHYFA